MRKNTRYRGVILLSIEDVVRCNKYWVEVVMTCP